MMTTAVNMNAPPSPPARTGTPPAAKKGGHGIAAYLRLAGRRRGDLEHLDPVLLHDRTDLLGPLGRGAVVAPPQVAGDCYDDADEHRKRDLPQREGDGT